MRTTVRNLVLAAPLLTLLAPGFAGGAALVTNSGFESGFTGWTRVDAVGSEGTFSLQAGTTSPISGDVVPSPPGGTSAAMSDAQGPGSHVLYQDFIVPSVVSSAVLTFDLFVGNRAASFFTPSPESLDFSTPVLNQQARVDLLRAGTDPFSVDASDLLLNLIQTNPGDPPVSGYTSHSTDLSALLAAHAGETLRLRFAEADNVFTFQLGVDNVSLVAESIPEPHSVLLLGVALAAASFAGLRKSS